MRLAAGTAGRPPVLSLVGGKWTTFRAFGEQAADLVLEKLGRKRTVSTQDLRIGGGRDYPADVNARRDWIADAAARSGLAAARVSVLLDRYGTRAAALAVHLGGEGDEPLASLPAYGRGELAYLIAHEHVATLADLVLRRTAMALEGELSLDADRGNRRPRGIGAWLERRPPRRGNRGADFPSRRLSRRRQGHAGTPQPEARPCTSRKKSA